MFKQGYKQPKSYNEGRKIREQLITEATGYEFKGRAMSDEKKEIMRVSLQKAREAKRKLKENKVL